MVKTAIARYLKRSNADDPHYIEVKNSDSVVEFGRTHLSKPSKGSEIQDRQFLSIPPSVFLERKKDVPDRVKTLSGISTKYQYICTVIQYRHNNQAKAYILKVEEGVKWRRYPCFCPACVNFDWNNCSNKKIVGVVQNVKIKE